MLLELLQIKFKMKIWLDDQINDMSCPNRHTPEGFIGVDNAEEAIKMIESGNVEYISFDHDLGDNVKTGYDVALVIEELAYFGKINKIEWDIHSANPVGADNIKKAMISAERFWK